MTYDGADLAARSIRLWGIAGAVFRHVQAAKSWDTPRGQREKVAHGAEWFAGYVERLTEENDALLLAVTTDN